MDPASARTPIAIQTAWGTSRNRLGCVVIGAIVVHGHTRYTELTETMEKQFVSVISVVSVFLGHDAACGIEPDDLIGPDVERPFARQVARDPASVGEPI